MQQEADLLLKPREIFCSHNKKAVMICINPGCKDSVLACDGDQCQFCETSHIDCTLTKLKPLLTQIIRKKQEITPVIEEAIQTLEKLYDDIIQKLSDDKMHVLDQVGLLGLSAQEIEFLRRINEGTILEMKSSESQAIYKKINQQNRWLADSNEIKEFWKKQQAKFQSIFDTLKAIPIRKSGKFDSKISHDLQCIEKFFSGSIIKKATLLYRASQCDFSCQVFHQLCDGKRNVLVLAKTQFGKIIGGFAPIGFRVGNNYINDKKKQTFLFSITNREKFELTMPAKAIFHSSRNVGPVFGSGPDFYIIDNSNINYNSVFNLGMSFYKGEKYATRQQAIKSFIGKSKSHNCLIEEWEVFQLDLINSF